jgi:probable addiction module antidote protein
MKRTPVSVPYEDFQIRQFRESPRRAMAYLNACIEVAFEENDPELVLSALSVVARSQGMTRVAKKADVQRESLHRMLSKKGNPEWRSLFQVFKALHLRPKLERIEALAA